MWCDNCACASPVLSPATRELDVFWQYSNRIRKKHHRHPLKALKRDKADSTRYYKIKFNLRITVTVTRTDCTTPYPLMISKTNAKFSASRKNARKANKREQVADLVASIRKLSNSIGGGLWYLILEICDILESFGSQSNTKYLTLLNISVHFDFNLPVSHNCNFQRLLFSRANKAWRLPDTPEDSDIFGQC